MPQNPPKPAQTCLSNHFRKNKATCHFGSFSNHRSSAFIFRPARQNLPRIKVHHPAQQKSTGRNTAQQPSPISEKQSQETIWRTFLSNPFPTQATLSSLRAPQCPPVVNRFVPRAKQCQTAPSIAPAQNKLQIGQFTCGKIAGLL